MAAAAFRFRFVFSTLFLFLCAAPALAEDASVKILSPADGAMLDAKHPATLDYSIEGVAKADHVHLYVDGEEAAMGHKLKGSFKLSALKTGARKLCIQAANKNHTPIGEKTCINVTAQ